MPIYRLSKELLFPPPHRARPDGLLAVGGDLSMERLLLAYSMGIFPWFSRNDPILWWSPDPRMVLFPGEFRASRSLRRAVRAGNLDVTLDQAFDDVIRECARIPRMGQDGTWITPEMEVSYRELHRAGFAHSVECWRDGELVGGLYGISLGASFFGESMFSRVSNASKIALYHLVQLSLKWEFEFIDCQVYTEHLESLGAREIPRGQFLKWLGESLRHETRRGRWDTAGLE